MKRSIERAGQMLVVLITAGWLTGQLLAPADAGKKKTRRTYAGPYVAIVQKVTDSDTIKVIADVWPGVQVPASIRLLGVDTPEKYRPKCAREKELARRATAIVRELVRPGDEVILRQVQWGKYAGRVVARVEIANADGARIDLSQLLIDRGYGRPYFGGTKSSWCKEDAKNAAGD